MMLGKVMVDQDGVRCVEADEALLQEIGQRWGKR